MKKTLTEIRKKRGLTQQELASKLEIAISTYNQYENGTRAIPKDTAEQLCKLLCVDLNDIFLPIKFTVSK